MLRSIVGILAGYVIFAVATVALFGVSGQNPYKGAAPGFLIGSALYGMVVAVAGGYVAEWLAGRQPPRHGAAVGLLIAAGALLTIAGHRPPTPGWPQLAVLLLMAPSALIGALLFVRRRRAGAAAGDA